MNELTKEAITHVVITFSKTKYYLTAIQNKRLQQLGDKERISLGNSFLRISSISEILPIEDYYKSHPKERPVSYGDFPELPKAKILSENKSKEKRIRILEQMIIGITKFINNNKQNTKATKLKGQIESGLELARAGKDFKISSLHFN